MSLATVDLFTPTVALTLPELVDGLAIRMGAWVMIERLGVVLCHGTGPTACPAVLASALVTKSTTPLRAAVTWARSSGLPHGSVEGQALVAAAVGDGVTAWFVGCQAVAVAEVLPLLIRSLEEGEAVIHDPVVEELLHPRGPARPGAAPAAVLLVLRGDVGVTRLGRTALAAVAGTAARVHTESDRVLVALPSETDPVPVLERVRAQTPSVLAGWSQVSAHASDWVTAARLAAGCLLAAETLELPVGDPADPAIAAELVLQEAQAAVADLLCLLVASPLSSLKEHDNRTSGELLASLTAWCRAGFDVPSAAAALHVHVNTLRYRLKRAAEVSGLDLTRPRQLLALQLLLAL